jgi:hypothetical protein
MRAHDVTICAVMCSLPLLIMTVVTVASRLGGYWLMGYVNVTPRIRRMLDALPGSIIVAAALPGGRKWRSGGGLRHPGGDGRHHHPPQ